MPRPTDVVDARPYCLRRRQTRGSFAGAAILVMAGLPTLASAAETAEGSVGMPQLDFANPLTISQVVWLAIIFVVLYLLLSRWALPQMSAVLEMRASRIKGDLEAAQTAKASADAALGELTAATRQAQATAQAEIASAVAVAKDAAAAQSAALNERLDKQLADAEQRISAARSAAMGALRDVAADTATAVVTRLVGSTPAPSAVQSAVDAALAGRRG